MGSAVGLVHAFLPQTCIAPEFTGDPAGQLELVIPQLLLKNTLGLADVPAAHQSSSFT